MIETGTEGGAGIRDRGREATLETGDIEAEETAAIQETEVTQETGDIEVEEITGEAQDLKAEIEKDHPLLTADAEAPKTQEAEVRVTVEDTRMSEPRLPEETPEQGQTRDRGLETP